MNASTVEDTVQVDEVSECLLSSHLNGLAHERESLSVCIVSAAVTVVLSLTRAHAHSSHVHL